MLSSNSAQQTGRRNLELGYNFPKSDGFAGEEAFDLSLEGRVQVCHRHRVTGKGVGVQRLVASVEAENSACFAKDLDFLFPFCRFKN